MKFLFCIAMVFCSAIIGSGQAPPRLTFSNGIVSVVGFSHLAEPITISESGWREILSVYTDQAFVKKIDQPISGSYSFSENQILFQPTFSFAPGVTYHAVFSPAAFAQNSGVKGEQLIQDKIELTFEIPTENHSRTSIEAIYPQSVNLPENLLRMYIYFSQPMMPGKAYDHIKLFNERGEQVEKPFLIVDQELWNTDRTRMTLLFDPGRIKRGLKSNIELGLPLEQGKNYRLMIDSTWLDINGNSLEHTFSKSFTVTNALRTKPEIKHLEVKSPSGDTREPLIIDFDRPMDQALVSKFLSIHSALSGEVAGHVELINDNRMTFIPDRSWQRGTYTVSISPWLEDVAGNNFNNLFDVDLTKESRNNSQQLLTLPFTVQSPAR